MIKPQFQCLTQECIRPESICQDGEPTGKPTPPPRTTTVTSPNFCTAIVEIHSFGGCGLCPTCNAANPGGPIATATAAHTNPGGPIITGIVNPGGPIINGRELTTSGCSTTMTVSTTVPGRCECPLLLASCPEGETVAVQALPTSTVTEGCVVSVVTGPGCPCPFCSL